MLILTARSRGTKKDRKLTPCSYTQRARARKKKTVKETHVMLLQRARARQTRRKGNVLHDHTHTTHTARASAQKKKERELTSCSYTQRARAENTDTLNLIHSHPLVLILTRSLTHSLTHIGRVQRFLSTWLIPQTTTM